MRRGLEKIEAVEASAPQVAAAAIARLKAPQEAETEEAASSAA